MSMMPSAKPSKRIIIIINMLLVVIIFIEPVVTFIFVIMVGGRRWRGDRVLFARTIVVGSCHGRIAILCRGLRIRSCFRLARGRRSSWFYCLNR